MIKKYKILLQEILNYFNTLLIWKKELIYGLSNQIAERKKVDKKILFNIMRISIIGRSDSPPINDVIYVIGKSEIIRRLKVIINKI